MNRLHFVWVIASAIAFNTVIAQANDTKPDQLIERVSQQVLGKIKSDEEVQAGNPKRIAALVDQIVMPHVDFERTTALAVGRGWRQASPAQRTRLVKAFRNLLVSTYSRAMGEVQHLKIRMKRFRADPADDNVIVRSEIVGRGEPIAIAYRMERTNDVWKIYDLNILGVWFVQTYRNQFRALLNQKGVAGLIDALEAKNKQLEKKAQ